jgi:hypothetical protein
MRTVISTPILSASKAAFAICLTIVPLLFVSADAAQKIRKFVGLEFGYSTFQFDEKIDQKLIFQTLSLTAGFGSGPYNFLINYSSSLDSAEVSEEDFIGSADRSDIDLVMFANLVSHSIFLPAIKRVKRHLNPLTGKS